MKLPDEFPEDFVSALEAKVGIKGDEPPDDAASSAAGAGDVDEPAPAPEPDEPAKPAEDLKIDDEPASPPDDDAEPAAAAPTAEGKTYWDQTPEEKRAQVFNDTKAHSLRQKEELEALRVENERLKAGKTPAEPKVAEVAPPPDLDTWIRTAIVADDETKLTEAQREIRKAGVDLDTFNREVLKPALDAAAKANEDLAKATAAVAKQENALEWLEQRAKETGSSFYDDEIAAAQQKLDRLRTVAANADGAQIRADRNAEKLTAKRDLHIGQTRARAQRLLGEEVQTFKTKAARDQEAAETERAQAEIDAEWTADLAAVQKETGLSGALWNTAMKAAHRFVEEKAETEVIPKGGFKALIHEAIKPILEASGKTQAERREAIAAEPGAGRVATQTREATPKSLKDLQRDAVRELQSAFR